ncbi:2-C-methyl-D-erythritol 4-phosphate cytidylyltransferase [Sulfitobacter sp. JBTF-M27]|uniref:2-C-methyl-D-erythritol 4-phosphate cytidylyltransferase n=1 Tax=Sulfitobacter sediminilitoris TaxID=2698830 RepID=A0A6P0CG44_9RHOB|nr:2-C-methyl-D-erythritol 4-phosphate cytidylyltransferase [Sulfitobacter sediminilitoris]NEK24897.1 2-C-methyl-D-erythritol 4-phosphate cytidylyltransferase [Sulfitobacter sediminilitoris]
MTAAALIVAAGRGTRFGSEVPKQYVPIAGICAFRRSVEKFLSGGDLGLVQAVIHPDDAKMYADAMAGLDDPRLLAPVTGGATRAQSVLQGLEALSGHAPDCVLIHDAARPFVSRRIIRNVLDMLQTTEAAFAALPVVDALWRVEEGAAVAPVPRDGLWRAQTPQGFHFQTLLKAHRGYQGDAADDVEIARAAGMTARVVEGASENFKITTPQDLRRAEQLVSVL